MIEIFIETCPGGYSVHAYAENHPTRKFTKAKLLNALGLLIVPIGYSKIDPIQYRNLFKEK